MCITSVLRNPWRRDTVRTSLASGFTSRLMAATSATRLPVTNALFAHPASRAGLATTPQTVAVSPTCCAASSTEIGTCADARPRTSRSRGTRFSRPRSTAVERESTALRWWRVHGRPARSSPLLVLRLPLSSARTVSHAVSGSRTANYAEDTDSAQPSAYTFGRAE